MTQKSLQRPILHIGAVNCRKRHIDLRNDRISHLLHRIADQLHLSFLTHAKNPNAVLQQGRNISVVGNICNRFSCIKFIIFGDIDRNRLILVSVKRIICLQSGNYRHFMLYTFTAKKYAYSNFHVLPMPFL